MFVVLDGPDLASRSWETLAGRLRDRFPGWVPVAARRLALVPTAGESDLLDAAITRCRALLTSSQNAGLPTLSELRLLVIPGEVTGSGGDLRPGPSALDADDGPLRLELDPGIYLTGRAAQLARSDWRLVAAPPWRTGRGPVIPLFRVAGWRSEMLSPWHNPTLFGAEIPTRSRPPLEEALGDALSGGSLRVSGPLGVGKSRLVHRVLASRSARAVWAVAGRWHLSPAEQWLERILVATEHPSAAAVRDRLAEAREPSRREDLAAGYLLQLTDRTGTAASPWTLVGDDWHRASDRDLRLVSRLVAELGSRILPVLTARPTRRWPGGITGSVLEIPEWPPELLERYGADLAEGLELPDPVCARFLEASRGNPLFLEEGLLSLIHRRLLRRVYGSFFFAGDSTTAYEPSDRLAGQLLAEIHRLGATGHLSVLAAAGRPLPHAALDTLPDEPRSSSRQGWADALERIGWVEPRETPWGPGVGISVPAI